jgi:hypothetical protein
MQPDDDASYWIYQDSRTNNIEIEVCCLIFNEDKLTDSRWKHEWTLSAIYENSMRNGFNLVGKLHNQAPCYENPKPKFVIEQSFSYRISEGTDESIVEQVLEYMFEARSKLGASYIERIHMTK